MRNWLVIGLCLLLAIVWASCAIASDPVESEEDAVDEAEQEIEIPPEPESTQKPDVKHNEHKDHPVFQSPVFQSPI